MRVLSQVENTSFIERCWSTYSIIHTVKRNNVSVDQVESLVYVHYNLRLLSHYCEVAKNNRTYMTGDNNQEEANLEDAAIALEHLKVEVLLVGLMTLIIKHRSHPDLPPLSALADFQM
jgi:hypothetical protein